MRNTYDIAIAGATGTVGETLLSILADRDFPIGTLHLLDTEELAGTRLEFGGSYIKVGRIEDFDFSQVQIAFFATHEDVSATFVPIAALAGCVAIDHSAQFRTDYDVPLVIPEVNAHAIAEYSNRGIIATPSSNTIAMLVALQSIHEQVKVMRVNASTYQSVSGAGKRGVQELASQTAQLLNGREAKHSVFAKQIAFNVLPQIDDAEENGYTREEMRLLTETQKIWEDDEVLVNATAVQVPVFFGHAMSLHIETREKITAEVAQQLLLSAPGVTLMDDLAGKVFPTPVSEGVNNDAVFVGRIREDVSYSNGLNLWVVADNVRKGAALNSIQIAEILITDYL